jgi:hypothetical protein
MAEPGQPLTGIKTMENAQNKSRPTHASIQASDEYAANVLGPDGEFICHCYPVLNDLDKPAANARNIFASSSGKGREAAPDTIEKRASGMP